jgi:hypothetical protein
MWPVGDCSSVGFWLAIRRLRLVPVCICLCHDATHRASLILFAHVISKSGAAAGTGPWWLACIGKGQSLIFLCAHRRTHSPARVSSSSSFASASATASGEVLAAVTEALIDSRSRTVGPLPPTQGLRTVTV